MAHFAEIDENNIVVRVIVIKDEVLLDENNAQQESLGAAFCQSLYNGTWKQTSDDGTIRNRAFNEVIAITLQFGNHKHNGTTRRITQKVRLAKNMATSKS